MTLRTHDADDLRNIEDELLSIATRVRQIRQNMEKEGIPGFQCSSQKAQNFIEYLHEWSTYAAGKFEQAKIKAHVEATRKKLKKKRQKG